MRALLMTAKKKGGWQPGANTKAYYNINDNDTSSTIYDLSGNGIDQTWYGTPIYDTDATFGRVAVFNGSSYCQAGSKIDLGNECTWIAIAKTTTNSGNAIVIQNPARGVRPNGLVFNNTDGRNGCFFSGTSTPDMAAVSSLVINTWHMIVGTRDSNGLMKIYIDGVFNNSAQSNGTPSYTSGENLQIGRRRKGDTKYLNGVFKLFIGEDRCRTSQEILDYYNQIKANYGIQSLSNTLTITPNITPTITPNTPNNNGSGSVLSI